jgi:hypothetical protein
LRAAAVHDDAALRRRCDVGVADKNATGWSSVDARWKWNTTLPSPSVDADDAGADTPAGSDYAGGCTALSAKNGAVALRGAPHGDPVGAGRVNETAGAIL